MKRSHVVLILCLLAAAGGWLFWQHGSRLAPDATLNKSSANASGNGSAAAKNAGTNGGGGCVVVSPARQPAGTGAHLKKKFRHPFRQRFGRQKKCRPQRRRGAGRH